MTCKEKLRLDHPEWNDDDIRYVIDEECPADHLDDVELPRDSVGDLMCGRKSCDCWDQEYPEPKTEKEKNMATTKKTKAQLMEELETSENTVKDLKKQLKDLEQYKVYEDAGTEIKNIHTAFMKAGFSDEQAFELIRLCMMTNIANAKTGTTFNIDFPKNYKPKGMMR